MVYSWVYINPVQLEEIGHTRRKSFAKLMLDKLLDYMKMNKAEMK